LRANFKMLNSRWRTDGRTPYWNWKNRFGTLGHNSAWGYRGGSPTAVQAWQPCPLWELSPSHPILL